MFSFIKEIFGKISIKPNFVFRGGKRETNVQVTQYVQIINNTNVAGKYDKEEIEKITKENGEKLAGRIKEIPNEKLVQWEPQQSLIALQSLHYVTDEQLSDMFIELLAKSADSRYTNKARARYQQILSALDPSDAKLLEFMFRNRYVVSIKESEISDILEEEHQDILKKLSDEKNIDISVPGIPFLEVKDMWSDNRKHNTLCKIFIDTDHLPNKKTVKETEEQLEHLASLGLIEIEFGLWSHPVATYNHLENHQHILNLHKETKSHHNIKTTKGRIGLTTLGKSFLFFVLKNEGK